MSVASAFLHDSDARKPALSVDAALQQIASVAHLRGAVVLRGTRAEEIPAGELMRVLRAAWSATEGQRRDQVVGIITGMCTRLKAGGPVTLSGQQLGVVRSAARRA